MFHVAFAMKLGFENTFLASLNYAPLLMTFLLHLGRHALPLYIPVAFTALLLESYNEGIFCGKQNLNIIEIFQAIISGN